jgi:hypothetical protein
MRDLLTLESTRVFLEMRKEGWWIYRAGGTRKDEKPFPLHFPHFPLSSIIIIEGGRMDFIKELEALSKAKLASLQKKGEKLQGELKAIAASVDAFLKELKSGIGGESPKKRAPRKRRAKSGRKKPIARTMSVPEEKKARKRVKRDKPGRKRAAKKPVEVPTEQAS